jgi:glycosyltransferase involved in cell wall biosynthesis
LRILHVTNYQVPGYGYEEIMLAQAQRQLNQESAIVASTYLHPRGFYSVLRERFPQRRVAASEQSVNGVSIVRLPGIEFGQRVWIRGLERQVRRFRPDVVHCHNLLQFHPIRMALLKARTRVSFALVVDDHMHFSVMRRSFAGRAFYALFRALVRPFLVRQVDSFCAIDDEAKNYLESACGISAPIEVMPLGVDTDQFKNSAERRRQARESLGIGEGETVYLYTGKVIEAKGIHILVKAASILLDRGQPVRVVVVGDSDHQYLDKLKAQVEGTGHVLQFTFLPSRAHAELPELYAAADVGVWPRQESMAVYEALSMALPVIVSDVSGCLSLLRGIASTFRFDDHDSLAETMGQLTSSTARAPLAEAGRRKAEQQFSWREAASRYIDTYRRALNGGRP